MCVRGHVSKRQTKTHSAATFAFGFLVAVGVSKTLLTKLIFTHSPTPLAFSVLSCIATMIVIAPIFLFTLPLYEQLRRLAGLGYLK